ncbi:hypothetical protein V8G54_033427 [Vigna mungo]|uniref:Uncharacterized protein n=1 Tax=Vigna mungo TaxID=3915 RepID=A0AAQ3MPB5_VIGMU
MYNEMQIVLHHPIIISRSCLVSWNCLNDKDGMIPLPPLLISQCIHVALCSLTVGNRVSLSHALEILQIELAILVDFLFLLQLFFVLGDFKESRDIYSFSNDTEDSCHFSQYPFTAFFFSSLCLFPPCFFLCTLMLGCFSGSLKWIN